jgi:hypothetical protein
MPKKITESFSCDLCGYDRKESNQKGWIHITQDDFERDERKWVERYICPTCINDIIGAIKREDYV